MAADGCSSTHTEGDDDKVDQALEEEKEVGVAGTGVRELQLQGI